MTFRNQRGTLGRLAAEIFGAVLGADNGVIRARSQPFIADRRKPAAISLAEGNRKDQRKPPSPALVTSELRKRREARGWIRARRPDRMRSMSHSAGRVTVSRRTIRLNCAFRTRIRNVVPR